MANSNKQITRIFSALAVSFLLSNSIASAQASYPQAVQDYNTGNYARALSEFETLESRYPTNILVHYYSALCHQSVGHIDHARSEFRWVIDHGTPPLKAMAVSGLQQLASAHGSRPALTPVVTAAPAPPSPSSNPADQKTKVKTIIAFHADWCRACHTFAPVFYSTMQKFHDIDFQRLDVTDRGSYADQVDKYGVTTFPHMVFLDSDGAVLYNGRCPLDVRTFANLINRYR